MKHCHRLLAATILFGCAPVTAAVAPAEPVHVPVFRENFPDPFVLAIPGGFVAYSTNDGPNLPMATSTDLINWRYVTDPAAPAKRLDGLPKMPSWVKPGFTWAPEVMKIGGRYVLYYTANHRARDLQCIGAATSASPTGPFVDNATAPLVCQFDKGGSIDANPFRDKDGKLYLYWKSDGNRVRQGTRLWGQQLGPDGVSLVGPAADIGLTDKDPWEQSVIEAPSMVRTPDGLVMFYSGGYFGWNENQRFSPYSMNYAMCSGPLGPCKDAGPKPILYSYNDAKDAGCLSGPGHQTIFSAKGGTFIAFHGWATNSGCRKAKDARNLYVAPFGWENKTPVIAPSLR